MNHKFKILIAGITLDKANITPLLLKIKEWHIPVVFWGNQELEANIKRLQIVRNNYKFIYSRHSGRFSDSLYYFIFESFKRNLEAIYQAKTHIKDKYQLVYSISSVLDLIIAPFFLKLFYPKVIWLTVFDNTVSLFVEGNPVIRFLAWVFYRISLILIRKADIIFASTPSLYQYLLSKGYPNYQIVQSAFGVETNLIKLTPETKTKKYDALFIGRINPAKGIYDMLEVVKIIKLSLPNFKLAVMGSADKQSLGNFESKIKELSLEKNIIMLGQVEGIDKFKIIKSSKLFLFLSHTESFGIALLEAISCGLPAFAYDLPVFRQIYQNGEINLFRIGDYYPIAQSIIATLSQKNITNKNGQKLLGKYDWEKVAQTELKQIASLVH